MRKFIEDNNISFARGERNTSVVTLIGYAQFKGLSKVDLETELSNEIEKDGFIEDEIDRLWDYCKDRKYAAFWKKKEAKVKYIF